MTLAFISILVLAVVPGIVFALSLVKTAANADRIYAELWKETFNRRDSETRRKQR